MDAEQTEDSFPLLPFSPQCGHLYRVWLIIPHPQTWQADAVTLKVCACVSVLHLCVCVLFLLLLLSILILSPRICMYAHACYVNNHVCGLFECVCLPVCWCVRGWGGEATDNWCLCVSVCDIYDTFYLFIVVLPPVTTSPRGNQASLVLISDMSQMVCVSGKGERLMEVV